MAVNNSVDVVAMLPEQLASASPDLARQMLMSLAQALMSADVDGLRRRLPGRSVRIG